MTHRKIPSDIIEALKDEVDVPGWEYVAEQHMDNSRWRSHWWLVVRDTEDETFWAVRYEQGLTENQDDTCPWLDGDEVEAFKVWPQTVTMTVYRKLS